MCIGYVVVMYGLEAFFCLFQIMSAFYFFFFNCKHLEEKNNMVWFGHA